MFEFTSYSIIATLKIALHLCDGRVSRLLCNNNLIYRTQQKLVETLTLLTDIIKVKGEGDEST